MAVDAPRVLHVGPDVRGGMTEALRGLLASPLAERYRQEFVPTHRGPGALRRLAVYLSALLRLTWWSLRGRGRIVHVHATVRGSMYRKAVCVLLAKALRRRVVLHVHSGPGDVSTFRAGLGLVSVAFLRFGFRLADVVLAVSSASAVALAEAFEVEGLVVIPNAAPAVSERVAKRAANDPPTAVYFGGFANPVKGGSVLLDALARSEAAGLRVVLAGPGELPPAGRTLVEDGVEWRGWLDPPERDRTLRTADIFILPSTSEGLPMALLEALANGLAIVATEVGGVPDVVDPEREALIVPPADPTGLAEALGRLAANPDLRDRLGRAARERARRLGPAAVAARIDAVYRRLL
jgi:glycosyltransferase involved in cell wall biosynthesis